MLNPSRDKRRPCRVKGSFCIKVQVDIEGFQHSNSGKVASRIQGFKDKVPT